MSEEEVLTIADFEDLPMKLQLTILYEELMCMVHPKLDEILDEIRGEEE